MKELSHTSYWDVRVGEQLSIGSGIKLRVEQKSGQLARIRVDSVERLQVKKVPQSAIAFAKLGVK